MLLGEKRKGSNLKKEAVYLIKEEKDYEEISSSIVFQLVNEEHKLIAVTSAEHGEGKTRMCRKLALTFAKRGQRTLLMDCDLRNPQIHKIMGVSNEKGLTEVLRGKVQLEEAIQASRYTGLYLLTAGEVADDPEVVLGKQELINIFHQLGKAFDYILINTSPVNGHIDALMLSRAVSGYLLIVSEENIQHSAYEHALSKLQKVQAKVLSILETNTGNNYKIKINLK